MMRDYLDTDDVTSLSTDDILMLMAKLKQSRGPSKGLDLIYAPIKTDYIQNNYPTTKPILHVIQKMKAIFILLVNRKLSPQCFIDIMELNDIPLKYEDVQTAKQQSLAITHCYFKQPMKQFYNNSIYKIQTHNYGLLNLHGMILLAHTIAVLTIF